jgi:hypothetical protein
VSLLGVTMSRKLSLTQSAQSVLYVLTGSTSIFRRESWCDAKIRSLHKRKEARHRSLMCGRVLAFLILPTPPIGSLVAQRNKTCCH